MSRLVAGTLLLPNGQPMANASIYFTAKRTEAVSIVDGSNAFFNTNNLGAYSQSIVNGFYSVSIEYVADASGAHTRRWPLGDVFIEDGPTTTLEALLIASTVPDDIALGVFYQILAEAQQAAEDAVNAANAAASSAEAAAEAAASISIGTGPSQVPNNTILNTRLGTTGNLGTAAQQNTGAFATAAQGTKADSAIQTAELNTRLGTTGNLGTAAQQNTGAFATAAQGTKADSAIQTADLNTRLGTAGNLGTLAQQNANAVAFTGGNINGTPIGVATRAAGNFTSINANGNLVIDGYAGFGVPSPDTSARIQSVNGIKVGNVVNANPYVFDWCEKGTFTPSAVGGTIAGAPASYTKRVGRFIRLGNRVFGNAHLVWTAHTGAGRLYFTGLPFTSGALGNNACAIFFAAPFTAGNFVSAVVNPGSTNIDMYETPPSGAVIYHQLPANGEYSIYFSYEV